MEEPKVDKKIEELKHLHYGFRYWLEKKNYEVVKYLMSQFLESDDFSGIHTILMLTAPFKNHPVLGEVYNNLKTNFEKKMKNLKVEIAKDNGRN
jgi:hypothetical protein